ncbi:aminodeoxychorismate lyase [Bacillus sp. FJAT-29814]|uniref:aminodeoxychorismate lyase n=1 Tax=Bacillus sp. FJAT-29814 TaxID=1729688 RepID=UPI00082EA7FF|nr:aminodeoxychorismate lyase [Bacillus sp. FJAT-29814]
MRINLLSSFAAGLLLATTISGAVYFTEKSDAPKAAASKSKATEPAKASAADPKQELEAKGFVVLTKDEYDANLKNAEEAGKTQEPPANPEAANTVTKIVINVSEGMNNIDVGRILVQAGFIENAFNFSKDIEARGLQNKLRPGSYSVDSGMSYDQMIAIIYRQ